MSSITIGPFVGPPSSTASVVEQFTDAVEQLGGESEFEEEIELDDEEYAKQDAYRLQPKTYGEQPHDKQATGTLHAPDDSNSASLMVATAALSSHAARSHSVFHILEDSENAVPTSTKDVSSAQPKGIAAGNTMELHSHSSHGHSHRKIPDSGEGERASGHRTTVKAKSKDEPVVVPYNRTVN